MGARLDDIRHGSEAVVDGITDYRLRPYRHIRYAARAPPASRCGARVRGHPAPVGTRPEPSFGALPIS
jgi:hypothetical protein